MSDTTTISGQIISKDDFGEGVDATQKRWVTELEEARKDQERRKFYKNAKKALSVYCSNKLDSDDDDFDVKYNAYWSFIDVITEKVLATAPKIKAPARPGHSQEVAHMGRQILERNLDFLIRDCDSKFLERSKRSVFDLLLTGRGVLWPRYETISSGDKRVDLEPGMTAPEGAEVQKDKKTGGEYYTVPNIVGETVEVDYVHWNDYRESVSRTSDEVRWRAKRSFITKETAKKLFKDAADSLQFTSKYGGGDENGSNEDMRHTIYQRAEVWEIHCYEDKKVYFISPEAPKPLKEEKDLLGLRGFFPTPTPMLATITNDSTVPTSDYKIFGYLADKINEITVRIGWIIQAIKVVCAYDSRLTQLKDMFNKMDTTYVPVDDWQSLAEAQGFEGVLAFSPIDPFIKAVAALQEQRAAYKADWNEITGHGEIIQVPYSGKNAAEKQKDAEPETVRLEKRQKEVQRYLRDVAAIMAEIVAKHFDAERLLSVAGIPLPEGVNPNLDLEDQPAFQNSTQGQAIALLRDDVRRHFAIQIETDSTVAANERVEKRDRVEMANMLTQFWQAMQTMIQGGQEFVDPAAEFILYTLDAFNCGRPIEEKMQAALAAFKERMANPPPVPPDPMVMRVEAEKEMKQWELQQRSQEFQMTLQSKGQTEQMKLQVKQMQLQDKQQKDFMDAQTSQAKEQADMQAKLQDLQIRMMDVQQRGQIELQKLEVQKAELQLKQQDLLLKREEVMIKAKVAETDSQVQQLKAAIDKQVADTDAAIRSAETQIEGYRVRLDQQERMLTEQRLQVESKLKAYEIEKKAETEANKPAEAPKPQPMTINLVMPKPGKTKFGRDADGNIESAGPAEDDDE